MKKIIIHCLMWGSFVIGSSAEEKTTETTDPSLSSNPNSLYKIPEAYILLKKRIWREMNLNENQNRPFFVRGKEITKVILEGVKKGMLICYKDDKLLERMSEGELLQKLIIPGSQCSNQLDQSTHVNNKDNISAHVATLQSKKSIGSHNKKVITSKNKVVSKRPNKKITNKHASLTQLQQHVEVIKKPHSTDEFFAHQISTLRIMEDVLFDKRTSSRVYDIQSIQLIIPGKELPTGIDREIAVFKFKDLIDYLNQLPKEEVAWFNVKNNVENLTWQDAFAKRLFGSRITKLTNLDDATLDEIYEKHHGDNQGLEASEREEEKLLEEECFMFEY